MRDLANASSCGGLIDKKPLDENIYVMIIMYYLHSFLGTAIA